MGANHGDGPFGKEGQGFKGKLERLPGAAEIDR